MFGKEVVVNPRPEFYLIPGVVHRQSECLCRQPSQLLQVLEDREITKEDTSLPALLPNSSSLQRILLPGGSIPRFHSY